MASAAGDVAVLLSSDATVFPGQRARVEVDDDNMLVIDALMALPDADRLLVLQQARVPPANFLVDGATAGTLCLLQRAVLWPNRECVALTVTGLFVVTAVPGTESPVEGSQRVSHRWVPLPLLTDTDADADTLASDVLSFRSCLGELVTASSRSSLWRHIVRQLPSIPDGSSSDSIRSLAYWAAALTQHHYLPSGEDCVRFLLERDLSVLVERAFSMVREMQRDLQNNVVDASRETAAPSWTAEDTSVMPASFPSYGELAPSADGQPSLTERCMGLLAVAVAVSEFSSTLPALTRVMSPDAAHKLVEAAVTPLPPVLVDALLLRLYGRNLFSFGFLRRFERAPVERLCLSRMVVSADDIEFIASAFAPRLRYLNLSHCYKLRDEHLSLLIQSLGPDLHELHVASCKHITDAAFVGIGRLSGLRVLDTHGTRVTGATVERLGSLKHLTKANIFGAQLSDAPLLRMLMPGRTFEEAAPRRVLPPDAEYIGIQLMVMDSYRATPGLEQFGSGAPIAPPPPRPQESIPDYEVTASSTGPRLSGLDVGGTRITSASLDALADTCADTLVRLGLGMTHQIRNFDGLGRLRLLTHLDLHLNARIGDEIAPALAQMEHLTHLNLASTSVTAETMLELNKLTRLQFLDLASTEVGDALGECLLWWPALTRLHLQHTLISDAVMVSFEHLAALKHLRVTGCNNLTNMAFQILFLIEPLSKSLEMLAMGDRHITADAFENVGRMKALKQLQLWNVGMNDVDAAGVAQATGLRRDSAMSTTQGAHLFKAEAPLSQPRSLYEWFNHRAGATVDE